jgi:hypothetical protein
MGLPSIFLSSIFLSLCGDKLGESHSRELYRETAEQKANRIIAEELARRGWQGSKLATRRRSGHTTRFGFQVLFPGSGL